MITIRRIYAYLLSFAGLATLSVGLANLGQVLIDVLSQTGPASNPAFVRNTVALNAALALVGLPVWLCCGTITSNPPRAPRVGPANLHPRLVRETDSNA